MLSFKKKDRGFGVLRNPNPRFFEFESRLPGWGSAITKRHSTDKIGEHFTNIFIGKLDDDEESQDSSETPKLELTDTTQKEQNIDEVPKVNKDNQKDKVSNAFFTCISTLKYKEKLLQQLRKPQDPDRILIGPKTPYKPQTEKTSLKPVIEPMNVTKALTSLGMVTGRGMDNGQAGAQLLANQVSVVIHDLEQKRVDYIKVQDKMKREKENNVKTFKSADQVEKEKNDSKWETSKVREDLCLAHEAYQFFRNKYKKRYGSMNPSPTVFESSWKKAKLTRAAAIMK